MSEKRKYYVLRQSYESTKVRSLLLEEIKKGFVRQGWGLSELTLKSRDNNIPEEKWVKTFIKRGNEYWGDTIPISKAKKRYQILSTMLTMQPMDILIIPKQPDNQHFLVTEISEQYSFDDNNISSRGLLGDDFRHTIAIDPKSISQIGYHSTSDTLLARKKMRAYGSAVNNAWDEQFIGAINNILDSNNNDFKNIKLVDIVADSITQISKSGVDLLRKMKPTDLENIVKAIFDNAGYTFEGNNFYDKKGGDIDLLFTHRLPILDSISSESNSLRINIQVKQKDGMDTNDTEGIYQLTNMTNPSDINILISTVDEFSIECQRLAEEEGIFLINGEQLSRLAFKYL